MLVRNKRLLIIFTFLILLGVGGFFVYKINNGPSAPQKNTSIKSVVSQPKQQISNVTDLRQTVTELDKIVNQQDPRVALNELKNLMKTDPVVFKNCHAIGHEIGHEAYKKYNNFITALKYQDTVCSDGYLHGLLEQRFFDAPNQTTVLKDMLTVCNGAGVSAGRCYHGVGHGLMFYYNNDLPKALSVCKMYKDKAATGRCDEGVFMQNFLSDPESPLAIHPSKYIDLKNPFYPCPTEPVGYKPYCYYYAPILFLDLNNNNYAATLKWCNTAETAGLDSCIRGVGSLAMKYNIDDPKYVETICDQAQTKQIPYCFDGLVSYYLTYFDHLELAEQMCTTMETKNQPACNDAINRRDKLFVD